MSPTDLEPRVAVLERRADDQDVQIRGMAPVMTTITVLGEAFKRMAEDLHELKTHTASELVALRASLDDRDAAAENERSASRNLRWTTFGALAVSVITAVAGVTVAIISSGGAP